MVYTIAKQEKYIPKFNGNLNATKEDQFHVVLGFPSVNDIANFASEIENSAIFNFMIYVKSIHNFKVRVEGKVRDAEVRDIIELDGLSELFTEVKDQFEKLTLVDKKK